MASIIREARQLTSIRVSKTLAVTDIGTIQRNDECNGGHSLRFTGPLPLYCSKDVFLFRSDFAECHHKLLQFGNMIDQGHEDA